MTPDAASVRQRADYLRTQDNPLGGLGGILAKLFSFLTGGEQEAEPQPLLDLVNALRQFLQASPMGHGPYKDRQYEAAWEEKWNASENLTRNQLGLSRTIVTDEKAYNITAFSRDDGSLRLVLHEQNGLNPKRVNAVVISANDLTPEKLNESLERGLKQLTNGDSDLQTEAMRRFHNSSATADDRKAAIDRLHDATASENGLRKALHLDEQPDKGNSQSWHKAWKATDNLNDSLGISGTFVAERRAYDIVPFKNADGKDFHFTLFDGDIGGDIGIVRRVNVSSNASKETIRQALTQLTEGHATLRGKVLSRFDAATSQLHEMTAQSSQSVEQQLSPEAKAHAAAAGKDAQLHVHEMQHAGAEPKTPTAAVSNRPQPTQKSIR